MINQRKAVSGHITFTVLKTPCIAEKKFLKSSVTHSSFSYPLKLMVPDHASSSECKWLYVITYGGGLVQGDDISLFVEVESSAAVLVTTQSTTKVYDCEPDIQTCQQFTYTVADQGLLAILPDPLMCFEKADYRQTQTVDMSDSGNLILLDWVSAGRIARGECWDMTSLESKNVIKVNGSVLLRDALLLRDTNVLTVKKAMKEHMVFGSLFILGSELSDVSSFVCQTVGQRKTFGASYDNTLIVSVSPIDRLIDSVQVTGCVVRFSMSTTKQAYCFLQELLQPVFTMLGGNPFLNK